MFIMNLGERLNKLELLNIIHFLYLGNQIKFSRKHSAQNTIVQVYGSFFFSKIPINWCGCQNPNELQMNVFRASVPVCIVCSAHRAMKKKKKKQRKQTISVIRFDGYIQDIIASLLI